MASCRAGKAAATAAPKVVEGAFVWPLRVWGGLSRKRRAVAERPSAALLFPAATTAAPMVSSGSTTPLANGARARLGLNLEQGQDAAVRGVREPLGDLDRASLLRQRQKVPTLTGLLGPIRRARRRR